MPVYEHITQWECDRCGVKHFAAPDDQYQRQWGRVSHVTGEGARVDAVLCPDCLKGWSGVTNQADRLVDDYLKGE